MKALQFPLTRITIWFILGILYAASIETSVAFAFVLVGVGAIGFGTAYFFTAKTFTPTLYFGVASYFLSFCIGITTLLAHTDLYNHKNYFHQLTNAKQEHILEVVLREKLKSTAFNDRFIAIVKNIDNKESSGKIILHIRKNIENKKLQIGAHLKTKGLLLKHRKPNNPDQFNYGRYLTNKSILAQIYANPSNTQISTTIDKNCWYYAAKIRNKILTNLEKNNFGKNELPVIAALILGQQQDIAPEILKDYQYAGAVHILSVSGLHVGFILLFIAFLLQRLPKTTIGNTIRLVVIISSLWGFAFIAGLAPSVVRSVTMFSFVAVGMHLKRSTNIFHTLIVSVLLILLFQPSFLFDVGFQLSYVSLFFILWLQPLFSKLWIPKNKILQYFWDLLTVSFAAQIGALPLSVYYFHQFPGLFFVTNLIIIPFLSIIMALGVLTMVLAAFDWIPGILLKLLEWSVVLLNKTINWVASFEQFIIQDIAFNAPMLLSLYLFIIMMFLWYEKPNFNKMAFTVISLILFQGIYIETHWHEQQQKEWIVFNTPKSTLITHRNGVHITVYSDDYREVKLTENLALKSYAVANFAKVKSNQPIGNVAFFNNKKILILDSLGAYPKQIKPEVLLITQSPKLNLERLLHTFKPKIVVADASNYKKYITYWKATCLKEKIPFHATGEKGFYRLH